MSIWTQKSASVQPRTDRLEFDENQRNQKNIGGLVLGCIDSYDSESTRIFQHFPISTRFKNLCTAPKSFFANVRQYFSNFSPKDVSMGVLKSTATTCVRVCECGWVCGGMLGGWGGGGLAGSGPGRISKKIPDPVPAPDPDTVWRPFFSVNRCIASFY